MDLEAYKKRQKDVSDSTLNSRLSGLKHFKTFSGNPDDPTEEHVEEWVDYLIELEEKGDIKTSTIREYFKAVRYYFEKVKGEFGELDHISRRLPSKSVDHGEYLLPEEWETLRNSIYNGRNKCLIDMMYWYARRPGEIRLVNLEDIDIDEETITFNILKKKYDDRGQPLPTMKLMRDGEVYDEHKVFRITFSLHEEVKNDLELVLRHHEKRTETIIYDGEKKKVTPLFGADNPRMSYDTIRRIIKYEAERAGIDKNITPKSERHSRATHLQWSGIPSDQIAEQQLAHNPETDVIGAYVHPQDEKQVRDILEVKGDGDE